ncbi:hypothetical protein A2973_01030 [Candidatus Gottesmanbacteria bacterium RIFCSPLOWO2_01_FULL_49_10]|uniref:Bacterial Ig-like domain-containing protein n=1 Tax=Candidatus Gottesmanbacteria bacterium RIFCSPLOWO2_01_FULL_49_10 TaxID=1798396 RepID=A0A1F6B0J2_9BACT|nr:MAG: hypothetical protein A2973_01030 [Candidatus Gottesmanbacteria bacterium RIFCSPLOWO2_01_FULL_49_10]
MKLQNGFAPIVILLMAVIGLTTALAGYSIVRPKEDKPSTSLPIPTSTPALTPTPSPKPTTTPPPARRLVPSSAPAGATIEVHMNNYGTPITDTSLDLTIKNEVSGQEQKIKNTTSNWSLPNFNPGKYRFSIIFPMEKYFNPTRSCEGCQNKVDISTFNTCGYVVDVGSRDTISMTCMLGSPKRLGQPSDTQGSTSQDTTPPTTHIYYPQPNGSITYKIDGKVCAIMTEPTDDSGGQGVETHYRFDEGNWQTGVGYLCADALPNGPHTLSYYAKDKAGNTESTKTISFSVNIAGN